MNMSKDPNPLPLTISETLFRMQPKEVVALSDVTGRKITYGRLRERVHQVVASLNSVGYGRNDRIAISMSNGPEMAVAMASLVSGFTVIPLNPQYTEAELESIVKDLGLKALVVEKGQDSPSKRVARAHGIEVIELLKINEEEAGSFILEGMPERPSNEPNYAQPDDIAHVLFTSGTVEPKRVPLTQSNLCHNIDYYAKIFKSKPEEDIYLNMLPLFHVFALNILYRVLRHGGRFICAPGFIPSEFFHWLDSTGPTWYAGPPTIHQMVMDLSKGNEAIVSRCNIKWIGTGSASMSMKLMAQLEDLFKAQVIESYGMTEALFIASNSPSRRKPGSAGVVGVAEVAIMDEKGALLDPKEIGEIVLRGPNVFKGYENNPEANSLAFINGWFRTGDLGSFDNEGFLHLWGRLKEMINKGGEKVAPQEIDDALLQHPAIEEAISFAVPHKTLGEDVVAAVVLRPGSSITEKDLRAFLFDRLAYFKVPTQIIFVDNIPKGPTGKNKRLEMAQRMGY
jgi:acyl-CoA synthetase (AMP-forming)/AMP-acid ligase II